MAGFQWTWLTIGKDTWWFRPTGATAWGALFFSSIISTPTASWTYGTAHGNRGGGERIKASACALSYFLPNWFLSSLNKERPRLTLRQSIPRTYFSTSYSRTRCLRVRKNIYESESVAAKSFQKVSPHFYGNARKNLYLDRSGWMQVGLALNLSPGR